jgi:hypothetical protein
MLRYESKRASLMRYEYGQMVFRSASSLNSLRHTQVRMAFRQGDGNRYKTYSLILTILQRLSVCRTNIRQGKLIRIFALCLFDV